MANLSKAKGTRWESAVVEYLRARHLDARRKVQTGGADQGDISIEEMPFLVIEAKAGKSYDLAGWLAEANAEAINAGASVGVVFAKRRGKTSPGDGYVVTDGDTFCELLRRFTALEAALVDAHTEAGMRR